MFQRRDRAFCGSLVRREPSRLSRRDLVADLIAALKPHGIPVMVTYHPSYLLRAYNQDAKREAWEDLKKVLHYVYD